MSNYKAQNLSSINFPVYQAVNFDVEAFNNAILSQGVDLVHYRAMRCPVGMIDQYDNRKPHEDHSGCSNGFIYTKAGELVGLFTGNNENMQQTDAGLLDHSTVQVTVPTHYKTENTAMAAARIKVLPFDRFYLKDESITVVHWQLFEAHQSGTEKLSFPVTKVQDILDSNGNRYAENIDFIVSGGQIKWISSNRPGYDPELNKGQVCSIRFEYRPYYYVSRMIHEVRVTQLEDEVTGERKTVVMPQAFSITREYSFEKELRDENDEAPESPRTAKAPGNGSFGPR